MPVPDITFAQPARRNLLAPVLLAFLLLGIVLALVIRFTPHRTAGLTIVHTTTFPTHTVFKSDSILVHTDPSEDDLYVVTTLRIDDQLHLPLFLKDFTANVVTAEGQEFTTSAIEERDLPNLFTSYPALRPLATDPLLRETMIAPGASAQGVILLRFPITQAAWERRRSAVLNLDLYHQGNQSINIDRESETIAKVSSSDPKS
jgi:hypothetical protein